MPPISPNELLRAAVVHHQAGRASEAESLYLQVLAAVPGQADALHLLGVLRGQVGKAAEAAELIGRAIAASSAAPAAWFSNLGKFLVDAGDSEGAEEACRRAVELKPDFVEAHVNLGNAFRLSGNAAAAAAEYRYAIRLNPSLAMAHKQLGVALHAMGNLAEAAVAFREALRLNPADAEAAQLLGLALRAAGDNAGATAAFQQALRIKPDYAAAANNLGNAFQSLGRLDEARTSYDAALRLEPAFAEAHNNLASLLKEQGDVDTSVEEYRRAVALQPASAAMHSNLLLALNYQVGSTRESLFEAAKAWAQRHAAPLTSEIRPHANHRDPARRLRIGYVTADFREHASAFFLLPLLENHDPSRVEVFCYSDVARPDAITARCRQAAHQWREIAGLPDAQAAELIRRDQIDILLDLKLHADQNRLLLFARKPAPVQATWLGYPGTTGLSTIDYRLSDPHLDPSAEDDRFYVEKTIRLPNTFWCYDPISSETVNPLPMGGRRDGGVMFGCLNHLSKITAPLAAMFTQILAAVPASSLQLLAQEGSHRTRILEMFARHGAETGRIRFVTPRPRADYLRLYHGINIALDSWPVNGHTTTFDSLWMGVPIITLAGPTPLGRAGISQLQNLGLHELIADSVAMYVRIAAELAGDLTRVAAWRASLRPRMEQSPLMRGGNFARAMEDQYTAMWGNYCGQK